MLNKRYIKSNIFFYIISILIIKKLNEKLRIYIDYRILNFLIIKNRNAFFLIKKTLIKLYIAKIFNKFDIIIIFNKIYIKKKNKEKTTFLTRYNLFEYIIILFKFYNALSTF